MLQAGEIVESADDLVESRGYLAGQRNCLFAFLVVAQQNIAQDVAGAADLSACRRRLGR